MATITEKRAWLRDNGHQVPERGRLRPDLHAIYDQAHQPAADPDWDIGPDDFADDFADPGEREPDVPMQPERSPRTPRAARRAQPAAERAQGFIGRLFAPKPGKDGKAKPRKKAPPRIGLEEFTSRAYSGLGRMVRPLSVPMSNCLQAQAAMAGVLLEDIVAGTLLDRALQPIARAEDKIDKGIALIAPPVLVLAIEQTFQLPPGEQAMRQAVLMPVLRETLRIGMKVSEQYTDQIRARIEQEARWDAEIDELIALIFGQPQAEVVPEPEMAGATA